MDLLLFCLYISHLHILKADELLRVRYHIWDCSPNRKVSVAFIANKLLHSLQHHPERWSLVETQQHKILHKTSISLNTGLKIKEIQPYFHENSQYLWCNVGTLLTIEEVFNYTGNLHKYELLREECRQLWLLPGRQDMLYGTQKSISDWHLGWVQSSIDILNGFLKVFFILWDTVLVFQNP